MALMITIFIIACPDALVLATPMAVMEALLRGPIHPIGGSDQSHRRHDGNCLTIKINSGNGWKLTAVMAGGASLP
jgi:hypothetical protein